MSKLSAILAVVATGLLFTVGGCATKSDIQALRSDIAGLRSLIESAGGGHIMDTAMGPPPAGYEKVSTLVKLPDFIPGLGTLYVQPQTLPAGPFLAYDRDNRLASTIYMIPLDDIAARKIFEDLAVGGGTVQDVDFYYTPGHAGVDKPHYHFILWHMPKESAKLQ
jgi:hypothetical protein